MKEASGNISDFNNYSQCEPNARMFSGDDIMFAKFSRLGAKGVVSVAANVWPEQTNKIVSQFLDKNFENEELFVAASKSLFSASNPIPTKAILAQLGDIEYPTTRPPLASGDMLNIDEITNFNDKLELV